MSVEDIISDIAGRVEENSTKRPTDYYDDDGLRRCGVCKERKENRYNFLGNVRVVSCLCKCDQAIMEARKEEEARKEFARRVQSLKTIGLTENRFHEWRFENDNGKNPKLNLARKYVKDWKEMQEKNIGYVIMGPVGTGKSFFAGCIANALMEQGISVMMTNFSRILNELTKPYADKNQIIANLVSYPLLIIDDLGIERNSEFALEMIYNVIDRRYCTKKPLIVTTNLSYQDMTRSDLDMTIVSMGCLNQSLVHPREMLKAAFLSNAAAIMMFHNHPSGSLEPSREDIAITNRMQQLCMMAGIPVVDKSLLGRPLKKIKIIR